VGWPLMLGSWWSFIPIFAMIAAFVARIPAEERVLRDGLPGYSEYTQRVRWRLVPGIW